MSTPFTIYKLIVLYMLQNTDDTLTNSQISEFILDREYTNYFHLQQAISELVEAELITMDTRSNTSHYRITEEKPSPFSRKMSLLKSNRKSENI
jgi:predicted transcriptional regulator